MIWILPVRGRFGWMLSPPTNSRDSLMFLVYLGGGNSNIFVIFNPNPGEMIHFDLRIFWTKWVVKNHQLDNLSFSQFGPFVEKKQLVIIRKASSNTQEINLIGNWVAINV